MKNKNMNGGLFYKFLAISKLLAISNDYFDDFLMFGYEKIIGYYVSLVEEIDKLLNDGYTKEEIISFINQTDFTKQHPELTEEENDYLKNFALDIFDIRYNIYLEHKDDKIEVIEINKEPFEEDIDGQTKSLVKKNNHNIKMTICLLS